MADSTRASAPVSRRGDSVNCVEVVHATGCVEKSACRRVNHRQPIVIVRDTKLGAESPELRFNLAEWADFLAGVRNGEFDLPTTTTTGDDQ